MHDLDRIQAQPHPDAGGAKKILRRGQRRAFSQAKNHGR
jgi:hypothetical protein